MADALPRSISRPMQFQNGASTTGFPVLVLFGEKDIYGSEAQLVDARYPQAVHIRLDGTVHLPWIQDPEKFTAILRSFYDTAVIPSSLYESRLLHEGGMS